MPWKTKEARNEWVRKYRAENKDKLRERDRETERKWREANKEALREKQRVHRAKNIEKYREYNAQWHRENRKNNTAKVRAMHLKSLYGITLETYEAMLALQDGVCAACGRSPEGERHKVLHVDHCHKSTAIRGLLCSRCNTALGLTEDDPMRLHRYLLARSLALS